MLFVDAPLFIADLFMSPGGEEKLPDVGKLAGIYLDVPSYVWPEYRSRSRDRVLRENEKEHIKLLVNFTKACFDHKLFYKLCKKDLFSEWVPTSLEAWMVLTYVNSYQGWMDDCKAIRQSLQGIATSESSSEDYDRTDDERHARAASNEEEEGEEVGGSGKKVRKKRKRPCVKRFTGIAAGSEKQSKGMSPEGVALYNRLAQTIEMQKQDPKLRNFEEKLKEEFNKMYGGEFGAVRRTNKKVHVQRAFNSLATFLSPDDYLILREDLPELQETDDDHIGQEQEDGGVVGL
jgi:hypothetical protein